jgi:hypothetical protein
MLNEKSRSYLNRRRLHTWWSVPYSFFELRLQVVVVGLPLLAVHDVAEADLGSIRTPLLASVRKENELGFDVL